METYHQSYDLKYDTIYKTDKIMKSMQVSFQMY